MVIIIIIIAVFVQNITYIQYTARNCFKVSNSENSCYVAYTFIVYRYILIYILEKWKF